MIGLLKGKLVSKSVESQQAILLCGNVGYEVILAKNYVEIWDTDTEHTLWIHTHVREDILALYAFPSEEERNLFRILLSVSGLGPKTALSLLSEHGTSRLVQYILLKQAASIAEAQGVGKKLAERIVLELSGKIGKLGFAADIKPTKPAEQMPAKDSLRDDLSSALTNLGYAPQQVKYALDKLVSENADLAFEKLLKLALKEMSGRKLSTTVGANG